jgi:hypothetical protein
VPFLPQKLFKKNVRFAIEAHAIVTYNWGNTQPVFIAR